MPSCARKHRLTGSLIYHIFNRGNSRKVIFCDESDCIFFKCLLKKYIELFSIQIYHWVIMPNHYHLLLEIAEPRLISRVMAGLNVSYTRHFHRKYETYGLLWQGRFKSQPVQKESYLFACGRYIERNPVRKNIVSVAAEYAHSSARFYCLGENDDITCEDPYFREFGRSLNDAQAHYARYLLGFDRTEESQFRKIDIPLGDRIFVNKLRKERGLYVPAGPGKPRANIIATNC
ncbi:MAG TPA: transposase [Candidatus Omnitrophota bacterium]|nr:transposase [Candidatus Omnitrophota bacterium]